MCMKYHRKMPGKWSPGYIASTLSRLNDRRWEFKNKDVSISSLSFLDLSRTDESQIPVSVLMSDNKQPNEVNEFLLSLIGGAPYGIISINHEGKIVVINRLAIEQLHLEMSDEELIDRNILEIKLPALLSRFITDGIENGLEEFDLEEELVGERYLTFRGRKIKNGLIVTIADITNIKEAEYVALNSMLEGQEMERKRIAREIHDGIGPLLSTVKMNLANIEGDINHLDPDVQQKFKKSYQLIDEAANDLRSISHNLMPKVLADFGLQEALESLCEKISLAKKVNVKFIHNNENFDLDEVSELGLYRICQELINNSLKHAQSKNIFIQIFQNKDLIRLTYEDDGKGFDLDQIGEGLGLMNIENRVKALAGELIIDSSVGNGMSATVEIPKPLTDNE